MTFREWIAQSFKYELYVLLIVTLGAMAIQPFLIIAVGVVVLFAVMRYLGSQTPWSRIVTPVDLAMAGLCLMLPVTWWVTIDIESTSWQVLRLLNGVGLFYAFTYWLSTEISVTKLHQAIITLDALGVFVVVIGLLTTKWPMGKSSGFDSLYQYLIDFSTSSTHPNVLAGTILLFLPMPIISFILPLVVQRRHGHNLVANRYKMGWLSLSCITAIIMVSGLLLTQSRGALLGLMAAALVLVFIIGGKRVRMLFLVGLTFGSILSFLLPDHVFTLLTQFTSDSAISTSAIRLEIWSRAYYMVQDFPFTGIGMGNFRQVLELMYPLFLTTEIIPHAHNLFLQIATDLGVIGLICWLAIAIYITVALCFVIKREQSRLSTPFSLAQYMIATALLGSQTALLVHGLVDAVTWGSVKTAPFVWMLWGMAAALNLPSSSNHSAL